MRVRAAVAIAAALAFEAGAPATARAFEVQESIGLVAVTDAPPGAELILEEAHGHEVARGTADSFGSLIFRELAEGHAYTVRESGASGAGTPLQVLRLKDHPPASFYAAQTLVEGFQYIEARDGTLLAAMVRAPLGQSLANGPFPTVIEYSGYPAADPENAQPSTRLATALGFATVAVNMRGSGCSGGTLDLFDLPTTADGYDIVEVVAAQPWVRGGKVGMVGISFPGISQLFVAGARPPHLAAIAPLSVIADIYRAPGFPGGIFNNGFAESWLEDRKADAEPAPDGGQSYAIQRVMEGDATCLANQTLRLQTLDPIEFVSSHPYYEPALMDARSPIQWVSKIKVPTFLSGAWQDEQTSADFAALLSRLPKRRNVKITVTNGVHASPIEPEILWRWLEFLQIYVAESVPSSTFLAGLVAPLVYPEILGDSAPLPPFPEDRFAGVTDPAEARRLFEADPRVRVLMDNGAGSATPGLPAPGFELAFKKWPPREARPTTWYFGPNGLLRPEPPTRATRGSTATPPIPRRARCRRCRARASRTPGRWPRPTTGSPSRTARPSPTPLRPSTRTSRWWGRAASTSICARARRTATSRSPSARSAPTGSRPTCRAAGCAPATGASTSGPRPASIPARRTSRRMPSRFPPASSCWPGWASFPSPICSGRARRSGSASPRPAATARAGPSTRRRPAAW